MKTEQQTRMELIDTALKKAGWNVDDPAQVVQEYDILVDPVQVAEACTPYGGHQFSDYVLLGRDRQPLAVVEAKKTTKDAALGREQAKQYCYNIRKDKGGDLPFCFYTNGLEIYFWDLANYPPRKVIGFPTLDDLERLQFIRRHRKPLADELINTELDYFKAINLGLTATPTDVIDHNTFALFDCEDGLPTFAYTYEEAVGSSQPYLCDFQVMKIQTKFQKEGISKRTISLEDQKKLILEGKDIEEINFEGSQLEKQVINKGTNVLIVKEFMEECIKDPNGVLPGKTIFFCASKAHARRMEEIFDVLYPEHRGELAKMLVLEDPRVYGKGGLLDQFMHNDMPRIAISVDMLDTGIDVREVVNLVFAKPVYSYTKFWQMIGRGTRLLETAKLKPWCPDKDVFLILDCWDNFEYFKLQPKGKELKPQLPLPVRLVGLRLDKIEKALALEQAVIAQKEINILRRQIQELPGASVVIIEAASALDRIADDNYWTRLTPQKIEFLRSEIKPLFRTVSQVDFKAMRFEKDVLDLSLALLSGEKARFDTLKEGIIEQIGDLPLSVHIVARQSALIRSAQQNAYWKACTDDALDELTEKLAPLMKFREEQNAGLGPVKLDLTDEILHKETVEFGPRHEAVSVSKYREMVEVMVLELTRTNPILQKIKRGDAILEAEVASLAELLNKAHPHITENLLCAVYRNRKARFIQFIRHILGIEILASFPDTVAKAFDHFIVQHTNLNSRQLEFLRLLKDFIIEREKVEKRDLIQSPFTIIHPQGIRGVFRPAEIEEILQLTEQLAA